MKIFLSFFSLISVSFILCSNAVCANDYHEGDKEGLRAYLRQASAVKGKLNLEHIGLAISDTTDWYTSENWVNKIASGPTTWIYDSTTKRERLMYIHFNFLNGNNLAVAGEFDCRPFAKLSILKLNGWKTSKLDVSENIELEDFELSNSAVDMLDLRKLNKLEKLSIMSNKNLTMFLLPQGDDNRLSFLNFSNCPINTIDLSKNIKLEYLYLNYVDLKAVDVSNNPKIKILAVGFADIEDIILPTPIPAYEKFMCGQSLLKFSTMPLVEFTHHTNYAPQRPQKIVANVGENIDISSEFVVRGVQSVYKWYDSDSVAITLPSPSDGVFVCNDNAYLRSTLTCEITNSLYPDLTLIYRVRIQDSNDLGNFEVSELSSLRGLLRKPSSSDNKANLEFFGLIPSDTLNWNNNTDWISKLSDWVVWGLDSNNEFCRVKEINLSSFGDDIILEDLDCSAFEYLTSIKIQNLAVKSIDLTNNLLLTNILITGTKITSLDLSNNNLPEYIDCSRNELKTLILPSGVGNRLFMLYCNENQLETLDMTKNTRLFSVDAADNKLTSLFVASSTALGFTIDCMNNYLKFSEFPLTMRVNNIYYIPQRDIEMSVDANEVIDLSSEYVIDGNYTTFRWFDEDMGEISLQSDNGVFTYDDMYKGKTVICKMTNERFPGLEITLKVDIADDSNSISSEVGDNADDLFYFDKANETIYIISKAVLSVNIYDVWGKLILSQGVQSLGANDGVFVGDVPSGVYVVSLATQSGAKNVRKIMKD